MTQHTPDLLKALSDIVDAKAIAGVRTLVAGWNGEHLKKPHYERHSPRLGARIETNCGAIYELDEALERARAAIAKATSST